MQETQVITLGQIFPFLSEQDKSHLLKSTRGGEYAGKIYISGSTLEYFDNGLFEIISKGYCFYSRPEDIEVPVKLKDWINV